MDGPSQDDLLSSGGTARTKPPVVRGARACTTCRNAKMKCIISDDDMDSKCQRCKRTNVECIFEKHRRGRKPGSKLSEASKMLRKFEKTVTSQRRAAGKTEEWKVSSPVEGASGSARASISSPVKMDEDDTDDNDRTPAGMFPAKLIQTENRRNTFFSTILNPSHPVSRVAGPLDRPESASTSRSQDVLSTNGSGDLLDPVDAGFMTMAEANSYIELILIRLNPFINLFDPALHTAPYIRAKSPLLFTVMLMIASKFFNTEQYPSLKKLANDMTTRTFADGSSSVEICQAFACLTYWKETDEHRTWTYIGYAARMAIQLGLNRFVAEPPANETRHEFYERRNRERTYLVLFVHDRSLSMQTGRDWMLPPCDLVSRAELWHENADGSPIRPEDVIVSAFVVLRRFASDTTDWFFANKAAPSDVQFDMMVRSVNERLVRWMEHWSNELRRAAAESFHYSFLSLFKAYDKLFLNSFGLQRSPQIMAGSPSLQAFNECYGSSMDILHIVIRDFAPVGVLRYGQDALSLMTAYAAIFLLRLLRAPRTGVSVHISQVHEAIAETATAYENCGASPNTSTYNHAPFLRGLLMTDISGAQAAPSAVARSRTSHTTPPYGANQAMPPPPAVGHASAQYQYSTPQHPVHLPPASAPIHQSNYPITPVSASPPESTSREHVHVQHRYVDSTAPTSAYGNHAPAPPTPSRGTEVDTTYWRSMFRTLGFGMEEHDNIRPAPLPLQDDGSMVTRGIPLHPSQMQASYPAVQSSVPQTDQYSGHAMHSHQPSSAPLLPPPSALQSQYNGHQRQQSIPVYPSSASMHQPATDYRAPMTSYQPMTTSSHHGYNH